MDYKQWSRYEAVPLPNGIITRRTGFDYLKPPEEINAYYQEHFGVYWFNELPKTDNVYSPTSQYYGCTLAPGIPLIPNLCRRPLRSPDGGYDYTTTTTMRTTVYSSSSSEHNNYINKLLDNGHTRHDETPLTNLSLPLPLPLPRRRVEFNDSGLDSDSEFESYDNHSGNMKSHTQMRSDNHVTLLSWIVTLVTTIVTTVTTTVTETLQLRVQKHHNHVETRAPLKHTAPAGEPVAVAWYQRPVLWLYEAALAVHRADVWLLWKVNSVLQVDKWGTSKQRRKWALILLLIPIILWAAYKTYEWLSEDEASSLLESVTSWISVPFVFVWSYLAEFAGWSASWISSLFGWFDGSWISYPWIALAGLWERSEDNSTTEESIEAWDVDWSWIISWISWPWESASVVLASLGSYLGLAVSSLGEGAVTVYSSVVYFLAAVLFWLIDFITGIPALISSAFAVLISPLSSLSWPTAPLTPTPDYTPSAPPYKSQFYQPPAASAANWDHLLGDQQALAALVRRLLASAEFQQTMAERQSADRARVEAAFASALEKIDTEVDKVKQELSEKIVSEESSVESKMDLLKQQIQDLQAALNTHKNLVAEQAALGSKLEEKYSSEQQQMNEDQVMKLKEQILLEVTKVREEIIQQVMNIQVNQKVVTGTEGSAAVSPSEELEAFVNATVERLLAIYDADKIAKTDYALASSGGSVLSTRCTETFSLKNAKYHLLGYPLWSIAGNDAKVALEPGIVPGQCWAFVGHPGFLIVELSENITVTGFTIEHLPKSLSPSGTIDTAPREFHVLGLESDKDDMPILLGRFTYLDNGKSLQYFDALEVNHQFKIVELVIESNHGNLEYTCLYRFRVHGRPVRTPCMYRSYYNT